MSNYCCDCSYDVKEKTGENACPYNYLYWNFLEQNQSKLSSNPRLGLAYKNLEKLPKEKLVAIKKSAKKFLSKMVNGEKV
jgi:deoxyribodipyrimidine photolyase-related protein